MTTTLSELLTKEQGEEVYHLLYQDKPEMEIVKDLKAYFATFKDELEAKGVVGDYLAYVLIALKQNAAPKLENN